LLALLLAGAFRLSLVMDDREIVDAIEELIDAKLKKVEKKADGSWSSMDESLNESFVSRKKADLAALIRKVLSR
jgi:hypothetical protein